MATTRLTEQSLAALPLPSDAAQANYWDTELRGFGVVVGRAGTRSFVVRSRVNGDLVKRTIGHAGQPRADGHLWTVKLARIEARKLIGQMADGKEPATDSRRLYASGPTLRKGLALHVSNMRKKERSPRSIQIIEDEVPRLLEDWLDRPIAELAGVNVNELHDKLTSDGKPFLANRLVAHISAVWNALDRVYELPGRNPARAVTRNSYTPSRRRVDDLGTWWATVQTLAPVRRDLQLFCMFTGMRSEAARHVRWEHINTERASLAVPEPKGGKKRAFTLPLPATLLEMLDARKRDNAQRALDGLLPGGDHGWVFASLSRDQKRVQPVAEPKEYRRDDEGKKISILPGLHTLRGTWLSVADEVGISELDRHVLANHAFGRQNVNASYIKQSFDHLAACQAKVETALWQRIKPTKAKQK